MTAPLAIATTNDVADFYPGTGLPTITPSFQTISSQTTLDAIIAAAVKSGVRLRLSSQPAPAAGYSVDPLLQLALLGLFVPHQPTAPDPTKVHGWLDTSTTPTPTLKGWNGSAWVAIGGGGGSGVTYPGGAGTPLMQFIGYSGSSHGTSTPPTTTGWPAAGSYTAGMWWQDGDGLLYNYDGSAWNALPGWATLIGQPRGIAGLSATGKITAATLATGPFTGGLLQYGADTNMHWISPTTAAGAIAVNVVSQGADPTGAADSADAIDAAVAAALASSGNYATVYFPTGTYRIKRPLTPLIQSIRIAGDGKHVSLIQPDSTFHANYPGSPAWLFSGQGYQSSNVSWLAGTSPLTAAGTSVFGTWVSGYSEIVQQIQAQAVACSGPTTLTSLDPTSFANGNINLSLGTLTGTGAGTVYLDQSNDPTFTGGVTTQSFAFTDANANTAYRLIGNSTAGGKTPLNMVWQARYFRVRVVLTGTPTSWSIDIISVHTYSPIVGLDVQGIGINAQGTAAETDGRWNTDGFVFDRVKWLNLNDVWVNKQIRGLYFREVWDSYLADYKVLKCGNNASYGNGPGFGVYSGTWGAGYTGNARDGAAVTYQGFNEYDSGSNTNNSTIVQPHCEDNKWTQTYLGRASRRLRFVGPKFHGDLAANSLMTTTPHVRMESAYTNQFIAHSFNRAGASHVEMDVHPRAAADGVVAGILGSDRNIFMGFADSARTNPGASSTTPSFNVIKGRGNRWLGSTFSSNPRAIAVAVDSWNTDNRAEACQFDDIIAYDGTLTGDLTGEVSGPIWADWRNPSTGVMYIWDGTSMRAQLPEVTAPAFSAYGSLAVKTGTFKWRVPEKSTISGVFANVGTAPTGAAIIVDVRKNGTSIYNVTPANRPTIAAAATASTTAGNPDTTALVAGDLLTVDVVQIGSTVAGADLVVQLALTRNI